VAPALVPTLALLCLVSALAAQTLPNPSSWFALRASSRWTYEHEWKSGNRNNAEVSRWTTTETITNLIEIPEGVVAIRRVEVAGSSTGGYLTARDSSPYLLHDNCIYVLAGSWDGVPKKSALITFNISRTALRRPIFVFLYKWDGIGERSICHGTCKTCRMACFTSSMTTSAAAACWTSGSTNNVGIVSEHYLHRGTYDEYTKTLKFFTPAR
jgi:hypothetical protein